MPFQQQPHQLPRSPACAAACLVIISCKGYEPKLELLAYSPQWVSMCKLLQVKPLSQAQNENRTLSKSSFSFEKEKQKAII